MEFSELILALYFYRVKIIPLYVIKALSYWSSTMPSCCCHVSRHECHEIIMKL